jgi:cystathionine beta-lyase/cystathionine gamma-synthase
MVDSMVLVARRHHPHGDRHHQHDVAKRSFASVWMSFNFRENQTPTSTSILPTTLFKDICPCFKLPISSLEPMFVDI